MDVKPLNCNDAVSLRNVWSVKRLPISNKSAAVNADIKNLPYLSDIEVPKIDTNNVMLLIGTDCPGAHIPLEVRSDNYDQPYGIRTRLGWAIRDLLGISMHSPIIGKDPFLGRGPSLERDPSLERGLSLERGPNLGRGPNIGRGLSRQRREGRAYTREGSLRRGASSRRGRSIG